MTKIVQSKALKLLKESERKYHQKVIEKGGKNIDNFKLFMKDFEESRQDRVLPFRN